MASAAPAGEGYIKSRASLDVGTAAAERVIVFEDGNFSKSLKNKATGRELIADVRLPRIFVGIDDVKQPLTGSAGSWKFIGEKQTTLKQGELQLELRCSATPSSSQRLTSSIRFEHRARVGHVHQHGNWPAEGRRAGVSQRNCSGWQRRGDRLPLDDWWRQRAGSWMLKTETFSPSKPRTFDSYEPFPAAPTFPGDGSKPRFC